jgi:hypothetical protein
MKRAEIDRRLAAGEPGNQIARDYHLSVEPASPSGQLPRSILIECDHEGGWAASRALAERHAGRWRKKPYVEAIEILDAIQV